VSRRQVKTGIFAGRIWNIIDSVHAPKNTCGYCKDDAIGKRGRRLYVPMHDDSLDALDTIIHESLHASTDLDEETVRAAATDAARLAWRLGWRKSDE